MLRRVPHGRVLAPRPAAPRPPSSGWSPTTSPPSPSGRRCTRPCAGRTAASSTTCSSTGCRRPLHGGGERGQHRQGLGLDERGRAADVSVEDRSERETGAARGAGPAAPRCCAATWPDATSPSSATTASRAARSSASRPSSARTGYTGEDGFELYFRPRRPRRCGTALLARRGSRWALEPIGLGARDTLRLEMRFALYGNDIDDDHDAARGRARLGGQARQAGDFIGRAAIARAEGRGAGAAAGRVRDGRPRAWPRHGYRSSRDGAAGRPGHERHLRAQSWTAPSGWATSRPRSAAVGQRARGRGRGAGRHAGAGRQDAVLSVESRQDVRRTHDGDVSRRSALHAGARVGARWRAAGSRSGSRTSPRPARRHRVRRAAGGRARGPRR